MNEADKSFVVRLAAVVLAIVIVAMVGTLLIGLFEPKVDNDKIFGILGPSFSTIIGVFVGVLGGMRMSSTTPSPEPPKGELK